MVWIDHHFDFYSQHLPKLIEGLWCVFTPSRGSRKGVLAHCSWREVASCAGPDPVFDNSHADMNEIQGCGMELFMNSWFHCELCSQARGTFYQHFLVTHSTHILCKWEAIGNKDDKGAVYAPWNSEIMMWLLMTENS